MTSFSCNDLIFVASCFVESDRLYDAYLPYACGQFFQLVLVEEASRLVGVALYLVERYLANGRRAFRAHVLRGEKRVKATAKCVEFLV